MSDEERGAEPEPASASRWKVFLGAAAACAALVTICYWLVDRPVVYFAHDHGWREVAPLHWLQRMPHVVLWLVPLTLGWVLLRRMWGRLTPADQVALRAALAMAATVPLKYPVKYLFGRYWPSTFREGNLSLLSDGAYGFNPFHAGIAYEAFPSGHTAAIFALATVMWLKAPRWRWLGVVLAMLSSLGVIGLYYHFVSDVIAGAFLGMAVGWGAARLEVRLPLAGSLRNRTEGARGSAGVRQNPTPMDPNP